MMAFLPMLIKIYPSTYKLFLKLNKDNIQITLSRVKLHTLHVFYF